MPRKTLALPHTEGRFHNFTHLISRELYHLHLDIIGLSFRPCNSGEIFRVPYEDIVGCKCQPATSEGGPSNSSPIKDDVVTQPPVDFSASCSFTIVVYRNAEAPKRCAGQKNGIDRHNFVFCVNKFPTITQNRNLALEWQRRLSPVLRALSRRDAGDRSGRNHHRKNDYATEPTPGEDGPPRPSSGFPRVLVLINPESGTRSAKRLFKKWAAPVMRDAGIEYLVKKTKTHGDARATAAQLDLNSIDAIVACSGDGIVHEVLVSKLPQGPFHFSRGHKIVMLY